MGNKRFIVFRIATILALLIASGIFFFLFYFIFNENGIKIKDVKVIIYVSILSFLLLVGIAFQIQNIGLVSYAQKEDLPNPYLIKYHTILLIFNSLSTVGIGIVLYSMILDLYNRELNKQATPLVIIWFCTIWFFSNLISIIGSLNMRNYLHISQIRKERAALESLGEDVN